MESKNEHIVVHKMDFDASVFIYLEKLADDQKCSISNIVNKIVREKALEEFKTKTPLIIDRNWSIPIWDTNNSVPIKTTPDTYTVSNTDTMVFFDGMKYKLKPTK